MTTNKILNKVDHTLLSQTATWEDINTVLDDAVKYETASACIQTAAVLLLVISQRWQRLTAFPH